MNKRISLVLPQSLTMDLEMLIEKKNLDQSTLIRQLLFKSVKEEKIKQAIESYRKEKISFGKAAEFSGLTIWEFQDEARKGNLQLNFTIDEAMREIGKIENGEFERFIPKKIKKSK